MKPSTWRSTLPAGSLAVGLGVVVYGLTTYGFLIIAARALGPERYAALAVLWAMVYLLGPGFFLPLEQEVARGLAVRRVTGLGGGPLVRFSLLAGAATALTLGAAALASSGLLLPRLFDEEVLLLGGLVLALAGYAVQHLTRGILAGGRRFGTYGLVLGTEGLIRLAAGAALALWGVATAGPFGLVVGLAPMISIGPGLRAARDVVDEGPKAQWRELSGALGYLLGSSLLAQYLAIAGPVVVKVLAPEGRQAAAGRFLASLVLARIPLFLFQAVQPPLLTRLSTLVGEGKTNAFRSTLRRLAGGILFVGAVTIVAAMAIGPWAVSTLFGEAFSMPRSDLLYLAGGTAAYIAAVAQGQALIALSLHSRVALAWLVGAAVFTVAALIGEGLLLPVERGFLLGSLAAAGTMTASLMGWSRGTSREVRPTPETVAPFSMEP